MFHLSQLNLDKVKRKEVSATSLATALPPFRDPVSMEATMRRQLNRTDKVRSLFQVPALIGARSDYGPDRNADSPRSEAQRTKPACLEENSCLNTRQPGYSCNYTAPSDYVPKRNRVPYIRTKKYKLSFPTLEMATAMGGVSPSRSPRLPSPPPFPEVQIGPKSPGFNPEQSAAIPENSDAAKLENGAMRRIRPGTKAADMAFGPPLVPLAEVSYPILHLQLDELTPCRSWTLPSNSKNISKLFTIITPNPPPPMPPSPSIATLPSSSPPHQKMSTDPSGSTSSVAFLFKKPTTSL